MTASRTTPTRLAPFALAAFIALAAPAGAAATTLYDSGTPTGAGFGFALSSIDWLADELHVGAPTTIDSVSTFLAGANAGETFTIALYANRDKNGTSVPDTRDGGELFSTQVTFGADGWNGASHLGWVIDTAGDYWISIEVDSGDTLDAAGNAVLALGVPNSPLAVAYTDSLAGRFFSLGGQSAAYAFGLNVTAVPEPASLALLLAGLGAVGLRARRRA